MPPPATARFRARPSCRTLDKTNMGELTVWQQPKWSGRSSGNSTCGQDGRSWPGRAKAGFKLAAVNRSPKAIQRGKSWPDLQRPVMAGGCPIRSRTRRRVRLRTSRSSANIVPSAPNGRFCGVASIGECPVWKSSNGSFGRIAEVDHPAGMRVEQTLGCPVHRYGSRPLPAGSHGH